MSTQKCHSCGKTAYPLELITVGTNHYHKFCFKCEVCKITLNLKNSQEKAGSLYCTQHVPKEVPTPTADRQDINLAKAVPKVDTVNQQFRGELVGQKPQIDTESANIKNATSAPKVDTVNQQLRGELVGQKGQIDTESMGVKNAMSAPKVAVVNEQLRGELVGQKGQIDTESMGLKNAMSAPKVAVVNEQFRGELHGQKPNIDSESMGLKNALQAPKVEQQLGIQRGDANVEPSKGTIYHC